MNRMFRYIALCLTAFAVTFALPAQADDAPGKYIEQLGNQALSAISDKGANRDQKLSKLNRLFSDNVDFKWVGRFVMGHFWREANDTQKSRYLKEYQKFLILHYTSRFADYTSGSFKITSTKDDGDGEYTVSMQMSSGKANDEPVLVDYRVRRQDGGFKIFDVIVEGVSLITTQRSEFNSVLSSNGIDYLIDQLSERSKNPTAEDMKIGGK